ncbi:phosphate metabolism protein 7 [Lecanora helva]
MEIPHSVHHALYPRQSAGSNTDPGKNSPSLSQFLATLVPVAVLAAVYIVIFLLLRRRLRRNYVPRTFLGALRPEERTPDLPSGLFNWIGTFNKIPDSFVLNHHSLDAFLFLRYLKISVALCFFGCLITWPVLFPVNATGGNSQKQMNILSFSNVTNSKNRYYAHTFIAWIFFSLVFYTVLRESIYFINLRQAYFLSPLYADRISSRTVLFTSVPKDYLDEGKLRRMLGKHVKNLWIANDCEEIENMVDERDQVAMKLEAAETKLVKTAVKARAKAMKKGGNQPSAAEDSVDGVDGESGSMAARWVQPKQRPTHRLKFLIGKKVDTINWCRSELERLIPKVNSLQDKYRRGEGTFIGSVFVEYYTQTEAQAAYQSLAHHQPLHMSPRFIGVNPEEVIWNNLKIGWASRIIRNILTTAFVSALIIFWSIPVAFVGVLSNIHNLSSGDTIHFLSFIKKIPGVILGVVQGLLPAVLLAALMAVLPIVLRLMAKWAGKPSVSAIELRVQNSYFCFQVIQVFLVTTLTSGAAAAGVAIFNDPGSAPTLLAQSLPNASNFYISYFVFQGLTFSSAALAQIIGVIIFQILSRFLDSTPRKMYTRFVNLSGLTFGTVFPVFTLLTVIAITYSIIAPLVLGFATVGLYLIYLAFRYNLLFVLNTSIDTKGHVYPRALQQTTTGAYLGIVCLIGLFGIKTAIGPLILMVVYLVFIALFHFSMNAAIDPLLMYLPKSLEVEEQSLLALEDGNPATSHPSNDTKETRVTSTDRTGTGSDTANDLPAAPHKKPNFITKFLAPHVYTDYITLRRLVPRGFADITYDPIVERDAFHHPSIASPTPLLWIPRDEMGVSRQECRHSSKVIPMTDEAASFDEKGTMTWDHESARPPIYEEKIYY